MVHNLPYAEEVTHLINDAAHKVCTLIIQEPGQGPEDWDVSLIQELGDCFSCLTGGHIYLYVLCEMVLEHQDINNFRQSIQLHGHLYASKVCMHELQWSGGHDCVQGHFGHIALLLQAMCSGLYRLLHLIGLAWPPEMLLQIRQGMVASLMTHILVTPIQGGDPMGPGTTKSRKSLVSPLDVEHRYKALWWTMKFCQLSRISLPSLLEVCSARSAFKSVFFCAFSQFNTVLNVGSSF